MARKLLILLFVLAHFKGHTQVLFADTTHISKLKSTTTIFLLPEMASQAEKDYAAAITAAWQLTPFKIIHPGDLDRYLGKPGYSFFCDVYFANLGLLDRRDVYSRIVGAISSVPDPVNGYNVLLKIPKREALEAYLEAGTEYKFRLYGGGYGRMDSIPGNFYASYALLLPPGEEEEQRYYQAYALIETGLARETIMQGEYANPRWSPGLLKTYLNVINDDFAKGEFQNHPTDYADNEAMAKLRTDTLYFCDGTIHSLADALPTLTDTGLARVYSFPMRVITQQELSELILNGGKPVNFVVHYPLSEAVKVYHNNKTTMYGNVTYKQIDIYNSERGVIYTHCPTDHSMLVGKKREAAPKFSIDDVADIAEAVK